MEKHGNLRPPVERDARPRTFDPRPQTHAAPIRSQTPPATTEVSVFGIAETIKALNYGEVRALGEHLYQMMTRPGARPLDGPEKVSDLLFDWAFETAPPKPLNMKELADELGMADPAS